MTSVSSRPLRARQRLGKYRIEKKIGDGGFASVFQAMDTILGIRVALKVPHATLVDDDMMSSFRREARIVARLDHPGIMQIRDANIIDDRLVITFPLGKETLADRLSRRMSFETIMSITDQLLAATACAHDRKVIHCDIKPENVILFEGHQTKLADFGIAKVASASLRGCGTGTIGHMAPEQAMGRPSCRSDVFSLGLIVYRMLTGQWPDWPYQWPLEGHHKLKGKVSPSLIAWLRKAVEMAPGKRYEDAVRMRNAFLKVKPTAMRYVQQKRSRLRIAKQDTQKPVRTRRAA